MPLKIHQAVSPFLFVTGFTVAVTGACMFLRSASETVVRWHRTSAVAFIMLGIFYAIVHGKGKLKLLGIHLPALGIAVVGLLVVVLYLVVDKHKESTTTKPTNRV